MLEVRFAKAAGLTRVFKALSEVADHVFVVASESGLDIKARDPIVISHVSIAAGMTEEYHCSGTLVFGLSLVKLNHLMKLSGPDDKVVLRTMKDAATMEVLIEAPSNARDISFRVNLVNMEATDQDLPTDDFQCKVTTGTAWLQRSLSNISDLSDTVLISVDKKAFQLKFRSPDMRGFISLEEADRKTTIRCRSDIEQAASTQILSKIFKAAHLTDLVNIGMERDAPFLFQFPFEYGVLSYYVAPMLA
jgi:proliferating cell nuclear antigen PCNA